MNLYKSNKVSFIIGLLLIIIIYSIHYLYFLDNVDLVISKKARHLGTFITTIIIYFIGTFHLGKLPNTWMSTLWHLIHISGLCILSILGIFDWFISEISLSLRSFAHSIQELLLSPVLYVCMGLLNKSLKK